MDGLPRIARQTKRAHILQSLQQTQHARRACGMRQRPWSGQPGTPQTRIVLEQLRQRLFVLVVEERLDTSSAVGELVFHVFGAIAHFERRLISERTRDGIAAARKRGRTPGRPPLDPETVSAARKLIEGGLSPARAAKQLNIGRATAYRIAATMRDEEIRCA